MDYKHISSLDAEERIEKYRKDNLTERVFELANSNLSTVELFLNKQLEEKKTFPTFLVIGLPRSGTTLITQLLARRLEVGYVSNLMARFYETPSFGAFLQKISIGDRIKSLSEFDSKHGVTDRVEEPHEFGYFWSKYFAISKKFHEPNQSEIDNVDIKSLTMQLNAISRVFEKPVIIKCVFGIYFLEVLRKIKNLRFIIIRRDLSEVAYSIYKTRKERLGDVSKWWSFRPRNYNKLKSLNPIEQIKEQVVSYRSALDKSLKNMSKDLYIEINLQDLLENPEEEIESIINWSSNYHELNKRGNALNFKQKKKNTKDKNSVNMFKGIF